MSGRKTLEHRGLHFCNRTPHTAVPSEDSDRENVKSLLLLNLHTKQKTKKFTAKRALAPPRTHAPADQMAFAAVTAVQHNSNSLTRSVPSRVFFADTQRVHKFSHAMYHYASSDLLFATLTLTQQIPTRERIFILVVQF